jgi:hypothetical protein
MGEQLEEDDRACTLSFSARHRDSGRDEDCSAAARRRDVHEPQLLSAEIQEEEMRLLALLVLGFTLFAAGAAVAFECDQICNTAGCSSCRA